MEEDEDFVGAAEAEVAPLICSATILSRDMVVIPYLVCVFVVEGLVAYVAEDPMVVVEVEPVVPQQALLVLVECHRLLREVVPLIYEPLDATLPHLGLVSVVELGEGGHDVILNRAGCLTLGVKRSVPDRHYHRLELIVDHECPLPKVSAIG